MFKSRPRFVRVLTRAAFLSAVATALWLVSASGSMAQGMSDGNPAKGEQAWRSMPLSFVCQSCHGANGEGGYGPDLAGRRLTLEQWTRQIREPYGLMPAFGPGAISDETIADVAAFLASLPTVASPGAPRAATGPGDPVAKQLAIEKGCAQCHSITMGNPRATLGEDGWTRADVVNQIRTVFFAREHLDREPWMPSFTEKQISADDAARIADYLFALGPRVRLDVSQEATQQGSTVTYTITVASRSQAGGLDAGQVFIAGSVPAGATFLGATATPASSVFRGFEAQGTALQAAAWLTESIPPGATYTYSYQVQVGPGVPAAAHAFVRWLSPSEEWAATADATP